MRKHIMVCMDVLSKMHLLVNNQLSWHRQPGAPKASGTRIRRTGVPTTTVSPAGMHETDGETALQFALSVSLYSETRFGRNANCGARCAVGRVEGRSPWKRSLPSLAEFPPRLIRQVTRCDAAPPLHLPNQGYTWLSAPQHTHTDSCTSAL